MLSEQLVQLHNQWNSRIHSFNKKFLGPQIRMVEQKFAISLLPVSSGSAGLLIIGLHTAGNLKMGNKPDVRTVNAHSKSIRGNNNIRMAVHESVLGFLSLFIRHACVIGCHAQSKIGKSLIYLLHFFAGGAINNTRLVTLHQFVQPLVFVFVRIARSNAEMQVFPRKPSYDRHRIIQPQMFQNIFPHPRSSRGGQSSHLRPPHHFNSFSQLQIIRTEIVPPLAQAMRFIHSHHIYIHLRQSMHEPFMTKTFRSHIYQLERSPFHSFQTFLLLRKTQGAVNHGGGNPSGDKSIHLIFH